MTFLGQSLAPKIGPKLPQWSPAIKQIDSRRRLNKLEFFHEGKRIDGASVNYTALAVSLTRKDIQRLSNIARLLSEPDDDLRSANLPKDLSLDQDRDLLSISVADWTAQGFWGGISWELRYGFVSALALLPTAYGYVHYKTLDFLFPTTIERLLWKISCILFMASGASAILLCIIHYLDNVAAKFLKRSPKFTDIESRV